MLLEKVYLLKMVVLISFWRVYFCPCSNAFTFVSTKMRFSYARVVFYAVNFWLIYLTYYMKDIVLPSSNVKNHLWFFLFCDGGTKIANSSTSV